MYRGLLFGFNIPSSRQATVEPETVLTTAVVSSTHRSVQTNIHYVNPTNLRKQAHAHNLHLLRKLTWLEESGVHMA